MSYSQITLASLYKTLVLNENDLIMNTFESVGISHTSSAESLITESAAAASAIASGVNDKNEWLNIDGGGIAHETIAEKLKKQLGYKIGIISSVNINHATPAAFYARQESRYNTTDIFFQLVSSGFDYFGGGDILGKPYGFRDILEEHGYQYLSTRGEIENADLNNGRIIAISPNLDRYAVLPYTIDSRNSGHETFTLAEHTRRCIELLYNDTGFFIMVEGGKIDWASHANDAASMIYEVIAFDDAIREAVEFYKLHPRETLIIVTGDHETGGLSLGYSATTINLNLNYLARQSVSFSEYESRIHEFRAGNYSFEEVLPELRRVFFGIDDDAVSVFYANELDQLHTAYNLSMIEPSIRPFTMREFLNYGFYDPLTMTAIKILNQRAGISWSSYSHTALPVPVLALGVGESNFTGVYRNTGIFTKLKELTGVN
jgi:alkaline phosphatase